MKFGLPLRVFAVFSLIYLVTWSGHYTTGDGAYKIAWAKQILHLPVNPSLVPSKYGIGHTLIAIPPLAVAHWIHQATGLHCEAALYTLVFVFNGALLPALFAAYLEPFYAPRSVWITVLLAGLCTTWWPYTKADFSEPLVTTLLFAGFLLMRSARPFWGMLVAGFTLTVRTDGVILIGLLFAWYFAKTRTVRSLLPPVVALFPSVVLFLAANYVRYHGFIDRGYSGEGFFNNTVLGLYGILLSSGKSIFLFSPPLVIGCAMWKRFAQREQFRNDAWFFIVVLCAQAVQYATWWDWAGDDSWGVRFVIPGVLLMCIPAVELEWSAMRILPIAAVGLCVQLLAISIGANEFLILARKQNPQRVAQYVGGVNRVDFADIRFNPSYSQLNAQWILFRHLVGIPPKPADPNIIAKIGTPLYDTLPPEVWAKEARWDFIWNTYTYSRSHTANGAP
jgi:hypothetical protein